MSLGRGKQGVNAFRVSVRELSTLGRLPRRSGDVGPARLFKERPIYDQSAARTRVNSSKSDAPGHRIVGGGCAAEVAGRYKPVQLSTVTKRKRLVPRGEGIA
jgi:hypothetical protein